LSGQNETLPIFLPKAEKCVVNNSSAAIYGFSIFLKYYWHYSMTDNIQHKIALSFLPNVGDILIKNLVSYCGGVEEVFNASKNKLVKIPGIGEKTATEIISAKDDSLTNAEAELKFIQKHKIKVLFYTDKDYPQRLLNCYDAPFMLFYLGNADLNNTKIVSIVGTRKATEYGKQICEKIIEALQPHNALIVSGLAYGIDVCAHKKALELKLSTVGVLGHGLDILYPSQHKSIAKQMLANGGLLTDFPSKTKFVPGNFPRRNRIVAGISDATIVIETKTKGGSVITAEIANSYNKDVFAVPGNIDKPYSQGCNFLIKTNKAALLDDASELPEILGWKNEQTNSQKKKLQTEMLLDLTEPETKLFELLKEKESLRIDEIVMNINLSSSDVAANLLNLEFKGAIKSLPGKVYQVC
jgi:DNA processing protein